METEIPLWDWPVRLAKVVKGNVAMRYRMSRVLGPGIWGHTDFSGKRCAETWLNMLMEGLRREQFDISDTCLRWCRSSDIDKRCTDLAVASASPPEHVCGEVLSRLSQEHRDALVSLRPLAQASYDEKVAAYKAQNAYLKEHAKEAFVPAPHFKCARRYHVPETCVPFKTTVSGSWDTLSLLIAGSMCTPWTSQGKKEGLASPRTESFQVWAHEARCNGYDIITLENSPHFPEQILKNILGDEYKFLVAVFGPEQLGWPCCRRRKFITAIRTDRLAWAGPPQDGLMQAFSSLFFQSTMQTGDAFLLDQDPQEESSMRARLAETRGFFVAKDNFANFPFKNFLTPFQKLDLPKYMDAYEELKKADPGTQHAFIVDLSQKFERKRVSLQHVPTILKNTQLYSFTKEKFFTAPDIEVSQGLPVRGDAAAAYGHCVAADPSKACPAKRLGWSGNGMHVAALAAWHTFVFANLVPVDTLTPPTKKPRLVLSRRKSSGFQYQEAGLSKGKTFDYIDEGDV